MKKILIGILIVLLFVLGVVTIVNGITVFGLEIPGYKQLVEKNDELNKKIDEAAQISGVNFPEKETTLTLAAKQLVRSREDYQDKVAYSSEEDVKRAREIKSYQVDFLFTKLGNYQSKYGLDMDLAATETSATGVYNLNFTLHGKYTLISDFIRAIENDSSLNFIIENFRLEPDSNNDIGGIINLKATFTVTNLRLEVDESIRNSSNTDPMSKGQERNTTTNNATTNNNTTNNVTSGSNTTSANVTNTATNNTAVNNL